MTTLLCVSLFVLGVLVFIHELGHFLLAAGTASASITFSLGFGPKLLKVQRGDTEYCISAIPLGGYVKMAGENPDDPQTGADDEFLAKTKWQRFQILIAGPVMNIVLAVVLLTFVLMRGANEPAYLDRPAVVGAVQPGSPAEKSRHPAGRHNHPVRNAAVRPGNTSTWRWRRGRSAKSTSDLRGGGKSASRCAPIGPSSKTRNNARFEIGTIRVLPDVYPGSGAVCSRGKPDGVIRTEARRLDSCRRRRACGVPTLRSSRRFRRRAATSRSSSACAATAAS